MDRSLDLLKPRIYAAEISLGLRIAAYMAMLLGYLFYCYNFLLLDYVRPYVIASYGLTLRDTAALSVTQNIFITVGSLIAAPVLSRFGRRPVLSATALAIGILAALTASLHTLLGWLGARALLALVLGAYYVAAVNLTVALFPPHQRAKLSALNSGMFSLAEIMLGSLGVAFGDRHWLWMVRLGAFPILLSPLLLLLTPDDRTFVAYGAGDEAPHGRGGWGGCFQTDGAGIR